MVKLKLTVESRAANELNCSRAARSSAHSSSACHTNEQAWAKYLSWFPYQAEPVPVEARLELARELCSSVSILLLIAVDSIISSVKITFQAFQSFSASKARREPQDGLWRKGCFFELLHFRFGIRRFFSKWTTGKLEILSLQCCFGISTEVISSPL